MKLLRSLRVRLLLMFMFVVMVTLTTIAFAQQASTASAFQSYKINAEKTYNISIGIGKNVPTFGKVTQFVVLLLTAYNSRALEKVQNEVIQGARDNRVRIILIDHNQQVVFDSNAQLTEKPLQQNNPALTTSLMSAPDLPIILLSTDMPLARLAPLSPPVADTTASSQDFLSVVDHSLWLVIVAAWLLALLLTLAFSNNILKPVGELTRIARRMEQGDLSQRVKIRSKDEIGKLAHAFNTMADSLAHSEELRRNMVSDVAHELRTPLTNIRGYLEGLKDHVVDPTQDIIVSLYEESLILSRLIVDLQELTLAEAGQLYLVRKPSVLEEIIAKAVSSLQLQATSKQLLLFVDMPPHLPKVMADAERTGQILRNLLNNAITHTPPGGEIIVRARAGYDEVVVSVQDTGAGIDAEHLPNIFERFYRADASRSRATGGSGLGLAIVKQMVEAHYGRIEVQSSPGLGSCFTFTLPLAANEPVQSMFA
jgi:two-component system sensor histidine kinase BaeS